MYVSVTKPYDLVLTKGGDALLYGLEGNCESGRKWRPPTTGFRNKWPADWPPTDWDQLWSHLAQETLTM